MTSSFRGCVHNEDDIASIVNAAHTNKVPQVGRRMSDMEKKSIKALDVFVYQPSTSGIRRWTDGNKWSPSRIIHSFMVYRNEEMVKKCAVATINDEKYCVVVYSQGNECTGHCASKILGYSENVKVHKYVKRATRNPWPVGMTVHREIEQGPDPSLWAPRTIPGLLNQNQCIDTSSSQEEPFSIRTRIGESSEERSSDTTIYRSEKFAQYMRNNAERRMRLGDFSDSSECFKQSLFNEINECEMYF